MAIKIKKYTVLLFSAWLIAGCSNKKSLVPSEFVAYLNSDRSGLKVQKEFNQVNYKVQLQTAELLSLRNLSGKPLSHDNFTKEFSYYHNKLNFVFLMEDALQSNNRVKQAMFDKEIYSQMLVYANTSMKEDFSLVQDGDTLACALVHLEPANSMQPLFRISLAFNNVDTAKKEFTLIYNDNLFMNGPIKFYFSKQVFENLPGLKI